MDAYWNKDLEIVLVEEKLNYAIFLNLDFSVIYPWYEWISTANDPFSVEYLDFIWQFKP